MPAQELAFRDGWPRRQSRTGSAPATRDSRHLESSGEREYGAGLVTEALPRLLCLPYGGAEYP